MKRFAAVALSLCFVLAAASCGSTPGQTGSTPSALPSEPDESAVDSVPSFVDSEIDNVYNLALKGEAFADSVSKDYPTFTESNINDGNSLTRWKSGRAGTEDEPSAFGLRWEEERIFDVVLIEWDACHPAEEGFTVTVDEQPVFVSSEADATDAPDEDEPLYRVYRRHTEEDDGQVDVVVFSRPVVSKSLTVTCFAPYYSETYYTTKDTPSCYELEVYYSADVAGELSALDTASEETAVSPEETTTEE